MGDRKAPHHAGAFPRLGAIVRARADANPATRCGQLPDGSIHPDGCGLTKREHGRKWEAGHIVRGATAVTTADLMPHCAQCNRSSGARDGNRMRVQGVTREW
jgi:hypothetical protein